MRNSLMKAFTNISSFGSWTHTVISQKWLR